jgi:peptidoglycan/xylan/chitin deacetylase (PgdA/CDA1 family)
LCYIPSLVDLGKFKFSASSDEGASVPRFVWCGTVDGWIHDVLFLVRAFAQVRERGYRCQLVVVGPYSPAVGAEILDHAVANGAPPEDVILRGWIDDAELSETYSSASALLLPLGDNDRSVTRMPNKLPEYLASARPVISAQIGAVSELLENGVNARLVSPGNENEFAEAMIEVLERPDWATYIGKRGRETGVAEFDYRSHVDDLAIFFERCSRRRNTSGATRVGLASLWQFARSLACSLAGLALIVSGVVRRARAQAFEEGVVTAVYFHSPKRRLFTQCVRWLQKYGYTFISEKELLAFLHEGQPVPRGAVWLSFDDGAAALMEDVLPLVRSEQLPITIFIPSGIVAGSGVFPWLVRGSDSGVAAGDLLVRHAMTVEELKQIEQRPEITIGSHTVTHAILPWCASSVIAEEVGESKRVLEDWLNKPVETFAYPNGQHDERSECLLAAAGYRLAATTESGFVSRKNDPWRIPRFSVADDIFFPEAICNLVGVWRPWIEAAKKLLRWEWRRAS